MEAIAPSRPTDRPGSLRRDYPELVDVVGPAAFGGEPRRFFELLWIVTRNEFRLEYANTVLGLLWTIIRPLVFFGVIFMVLRGVLDFGGQITNYGPFLVLNLVLFQYFQETTTRSVRSVSAREGVVRKMQFPRIIIPLSVSLSAALTMALNLIAVLPLFIIAGLTPSLSWVGLAPVLAILILLSTGLGLLLSIWYVHFEDTAQIWSLISRMLFYLSPILYPIEVLPSETLQRLAGLNPLFPLFEQARVWVIDPSAPSAVEASGALLGLVIPLILTGLVVTVGVRTFARSAPRVAEEL